MNEERELLKEIIKILEPIKYMASPAGWQDMPGERAIKIIEEYLTKQEQDDPFKNAPDWVNFRATDSDGRRYWYAKKPIIDRSIWIDVYGSKVQEVQSEVPHWRDSLQERPKNG